MFYLHVVTGVLLIKSVHTNVFLKYSRYQRQLSGLVSGIDIREQNVRTVPVARISKRGTFLTGTLIESAR